MRRVAATALVAVMTGGTVIAIALPSSAAAAPANPIQPVVQVVQTALGEVDTLLCELFGNSVLCGA